ncbi:hypothetical protein B0H16DRAFT_1475134 [Mycena metata]|uniref:Uncharacterized protein n=1 Tax=Mycena metata TaxID=1033252 RepID=A0AAD7HEU4_9AGAR|nr:hypothetical protein B0H16DRAFT_1475134 [Mycena metata]
MELALPYLSNIDDFTARIGGPFLALSTLALTVGHLPYAIEQTLGMFQNLPQLRDFRLFYGLALSRVPIGGAPLTFLSFSDLVTHQYTYPPLVQMLQTRRRMRGGAPRLSSFDLHLARPQAMLPYGPDVEKLGRLVEGGLRFRIHGPGLEWPEGQCIECDMNNEWSAPEPNRRHKSGGNTRLSGNVQNLVGWLISFLFHNPSTAPPSPSFDAGDPDLFRISLILNPFARRIEGSGD